MGLVHISVFGGRGMGLENSRCPDAFALPSSAAARSAPRGSGWLGLATPMDDSVREVPSRESVSAHVRGQPATARRGTVSPLTPPHQSGQLMCYKTGQVYLLLTVTRLQRAPHFKVYVTTPALRSALFDPVALPAFAHQRLWAHTLDEMHWRGRAQSRVQRGLEK